MNPTSLTPGLVRSARLKLCNPPRFPVSIVIDSCESPDPSATRPWVEHQSARASLRVENGSGGIRTLSISRSEREWSAGCLPSQLIRDRIREPSGRSERSTQGGIRTHSRPGLSRAARPVGVPGLSSARCRRAVDLEAEAVGLEPTSGLGRHLFSRQAPDPAGWLPSVLLHLDLSSSSGGWNRTSGLHVQSVASLPAATAPESSRSPIREGGFEPPPPDSKSGSLPISRFPIHCWSVGHCSLRRLVDICVKLGAAIREDTVGIGDSNPGCLVGSQESCRWTNPASSCVRDINGQRKERELNPQGSSLARFRVGCRRQSACPSVDGQSTLLTMTT